MQSAGNSSLVTILNTLHAYIPSLAPPPPKNSAVAKKKQIGGQQPKSNKRLHCSTAKCSEHCLYRLKDDIYDI